MISNPRSPRVRSVAKLAKRDARSQTGLFLLEGPQSLAEALESRPELVTEVYLTDKAREKHPELVATAEAAGLVPFHVTPHVLEAMADTVTPQGVVAVARQFPVSVEEALAAGPQLVAILEEVRDPGNAGTIIRAADAAGATAVIFTGRSVDPYNPKVVRSTTGSLFHVPIAVGAELAPTLALVRFAGLQVLAADIKGDDLLEARTAGVLQAPTAWLFGNEARGLGDEHLALVDRVITVPIYGRAESMNLATAASVCLYESALAQHEVLGASRVDHD